MPRDLALNFDPELQTAFARRANESDSCSPLGYDGWQHTPAESSPLIVGLLAALALATALYVARQVPWLDERLPSQARLDWMLTATRTKAGKVRGRLHQLHSRTRRTVGSAISNGIVSMRTARGR